MKKAIGFSILACIFLGITILTAMESGASFAEALILTGIVILFIAIIALAAYLILSE